MSTIKTVRASVLAWVPSFVLFSAAGCLDRPVAPGEPHVTARFGEVTNQNVVSKIDLLFMIDNSSSMSDKQEILAEAVPDLVRRLVDPICVNADGSPAAQRADANGRCPSPTRRDFDPIKDIHIGIVTSSLGGHGAPYRCDPAKDLDAPDGQDMSHLVARSGATRVPTFQDLGFLNWNPGVNGAYADAMRLTTDFRTMVVGVGQRGCGYEAQLEAVYRFLVDPAPYKSISRVGDDAVPEGVDEVVLKERADFLRPDSLVAIIAVTDENDYSFVDGGKGWVASANVVDRDWLTGGTSACKANPNDRCCVSCTVPDLDGCMPHRDDPACAHPLTNATDPPNLRGSRSKQQYGVDLAWPIERYIEGFTKPTLDLYGKGAKNPLFNDPGCDRGGTCFPQRPPNLVFFAGIIGVPWQDIARDPNDLSKGFQNSAELVTNGTWNVVLGDPTASPPIPPTDPHMIVSTQPRADIAGPDSAVGADPKNGHEWNTPTDFNYADLQYACTFPLAMPRDCSTATRDCDCIQGDTTKNPLCQNAAGQYGKTQFGAKAYPGVRELQLLKGLGAQGIVGSICPKNTSDKSRADYGYAPAIATIIDRVSHELSRCLPRTLAADDDGAVSCVMLEVFNPAPGEPCECRADGAHPGRATPAADVIAANPNLSQYGSCTCEIVQLSGAARTSCLRDTTPASGIDGWCYVDPDQSGDAEQCKLVERCSPTHRRIIRYVGEQPRGANVILCQEQASAGGKARPSVCQ